MCCVGTQELSEEVREIGDELRIAQREKTHLQERLELTPRRIDLPSKARTLQLAVERFERQLDEAEDNDDEPFLLEGRIAVATTDKSKAYFDEGSDGNAMKIQ